MLPAFKVTEQRQNTKCTGTRQRTTLLLLSEMILHGKLSALKEICVLSVHTIFLQNEFRAASEKVESRDCLMDMNQTMPYCGF